VEAEMLRMMGASDAWRREAKEAELTAKKEESDARAKARAEAAARQAEARAKEKAEADEKRREARRREAEARAEAKAEEEARREEAQNAKRQDAEARAKEKAEADEKRREARREEAEARGKTRAEEEARREEARKAKRQETEERAKAKAEETERRKAAREADQEARAHAQAAANVAPGTGAQATEEGEEVDDTPLAPLTLEELLGAAAAPGVAQHVYLVTLSALLADAASAGAATSAPSEAAPSETPEEDAAQESTEEVAPKDPGTLTREGIRDAFLDALAQPAWPRRRGRPPTRALVAEKVVVFREEHQDGRVHYHVALKLPWAAPWEPLKDALRQRAGLCSHWSDTHRKWWSAVRYGVFTTVKKPVVDAEPLVHTVDGTAPDLYEESQAPFAAAGVKRRREQLEKEAVGRFGRSEW